MIQAKMTVYRLVDVAIEFAFQIGLLVSYLYGGMKPF
jgi:hypothetical protein